MKTPLNVLAHNAVAVAKRKGILKPEPCDHCGTLPTHAHHYLGYERKNWLEVQWLCPAHHQAAHFNTPTQSLKYYLISKISSSDIPVETLLKISMIIKQQSND